jgi:alkaline phosphatase
MRPHLPAAALAACLLVACASTPAPTSPSPQAAVPGPVPVPEVAHPGGETAEWWYRSGAARAAANGAMAGRARNLIVFLGDGMGLTTVTAARILEGQRRGAPGEEHALAFEQFPYTALAKTYNTDAQTPDSAGTMTAIASGVKTRIGHVGVGPAVATGDCAGMAGHELLTILQLAESAGLATGIVTSTRLTHATPAATYAHVPDRGWEGDRELPASARAAGCRDIAAQFVDGRHGDGIEVALAGGWASFLPEGSAYPGHGEARGRRRDGRNLVEDWQRRHPDGRFAWNARQLETAGDARRLLGLFAPSHLPYEADRAADDPSLADLTRAALRVLQRHERGYVLLVEGGRIDHAHHDGNARRALVDTIAFSDAVRVADELAGDDTLVLVTADHSHVLTFAGYPARGNPILGKVRAAGQDADARDRLGLPYTTLGYGNGPGYVAPTAAAPRPDLTAVDTTALDYLQEATVPLSAETHGGEDVGVWARGPGAGAVRGTLEQHVLFHLMVQATPALRARLCAAGTCNADGVPVELPRPADFMRGPQPAP